MMITRQQPTLADFVPHIPRRQVKQIHTHVVGVVQYGLIALAMFGVSAVAGVVAGMASGMF